MKKHEKFMQILFFISSALSVCFILLIVGFILTKGLRPFVEGDYAFWDFISGTRWNPSDNPSAEMYGVLYMIVGSVLGTTLAVLIGLPISVFTSAYLAEHASEKMRKLIKNGVLLLASIPSVIYGIFGLGFIVPIIAKFSPQSQGQSLLAVTVVLTMMILPTMIAISENAISSVPKSYREGSLALGVSKTHTTFHVVVPAAKRGILVGVVLGVGRAIGEAMAVVLVAGNVSGGLPTSLFDKVRPLTTNVVLEMSYATGLHQDMLFATGSVLVVFIVVINVILSRVIHKMGAVE